MNNGTRIWSARCAGERDESASDWAENDILIVGNDSQRGFVDIDLHIYRGVGVIGCIGGNKVNMQVLVVAGIQDDAAGWCICKSA